MQTGLMSTTQRALLRRLAIEQSTKRVPSLIAGIVRDRELVWFDSRGLVGEQPPTVDTQYRIGSITKTFVAVMIMRLRDEGRLALTDRFESHISGTVVGQWSIAEMLAHSTGLRAESEGEWWERTEGGAVEPFLAELSSQDPRPTPTHVLHYSNVGYALLGELVSRLRGMDWFEAVQREILDPLGMSRTTQEPVSPHAQGWAVHPWADVVLPEPAEYAGAMSPAGQLWSTVNDMSRLLRLISGDTGEVLHPDTLAEMRAPGSVDDGGEWKGGFGLGMQLLRHRGKKLAGHTGSMPGFLATVFADPGDTTGAVFLANTTTGMNSGLVTDLLDILDEHEPRIPEPWRPSADIGSELLELTGSWYWGPAPHVLRILPDGMLNLSPLNGMGRASRFKANPDGTWTGLDGYYAGEVLKVVRSADGTAQHLDLNTFIFTRAPYEPGSSVPGEVAKWQSSLD